MNDTVKKEEVIDGIKDLDSRGGFSSDSDRDILLKYVERLTPAQPQRIHGRWEEISLTNHSYRCSVCGRWLLNITEGKNRVSKSFPYCHCGADMRGDE